MNYTVPLGEMLLQRHEHTEVYFNSVPHSPSCCPKCLQERED